MSHSSSRCENHFKKSDLNALTTTIATPNQGVQTPMEFRGSLAVRYNKK